MVHFRLNKSNEREVLVSFEYVHIMYGIFNTYTYASQTFHSAYARGCFSMTTRNKLHGSHAGKKRKETPVGCIVEGKSCKVNIKENKTETVFELSLELFDGKVK